MSRILLGTALALAALDSSAQDWQVVSSNDALLPTPGFPSGFAPNFFEMALSDRGGGAVRGQLDSNAGALSGAWLRSQNQFIHYARINTPGDVGPGRVGLEANHVFESLRQSLHDFGGGNVVFVGRAGAPGSSGNPDAIWIRVNGQNTEIARYGTDAALGPNLGANWRFGSSGTVYQRVRGTANGGAVIDADLQSPVNSQRSAIVLHVPGQGNQTCLLQGSTDAQTGPGIVGQSFRSGGYAPVVHGNAVYVNAGIQGSSFEEGHWRICSGAPQLLALTGQSGPPLGPDFGSGSSGRFEQLRAPMQPLNGGRLAFVASFRPSSAAGLLDGVFVHRNQSARLVAQSATTGSLGPNWNGASFPTLNTLSAFQMATAGSFIVFETTARTPAALDVRGLWRIRRGGNPEPVALEGDTGSYSPGAGQSFQAINRWTVMANGDIVADCTVNGGPSGLFVFELNRAPRLVFRNGQTLNVTASSGPALATVSSFGLIDANAGASSAWGGDDSWAGSDGSVMLSARLSIGPTVLDALLIAPNMGSDIIMVDDYE